MVLVVCVVVVVCVVGKLGEAWLNRITKGCMVGWDGRRIVWLPCCMLASRKWSRRRTDVYWSRKIP